MSGTDAGGRDTSSPAGAGPGRTLDPPFTDVPPDRDDARPPGTGGAGAARIVRPACVWCAGPTEVTPDANGCWAVQCVTVGCQAIGPERPGPDAAIAAYRAGRNRRRRLA